MLRLTFLGTGTSQGVPMIGCGCAVCSSADRRDKRLRASVMIERFSDNPDHCKPSKDNIRQSESIKQVNPGYGIYDHSIGADSRIVIDAGPDFRYQMLRENIRTLDAILLTHEHKDHTAGIDDVRAFNYFEGRAIPIYATGQVGAAIRKDYDYAFSDNKYPGVPEIDLRTINPDVPFSVAGFDITPISGRHYRIPVTGYRIGPVAYLTDFNSIEEDQIEKLRGVDVLVINALRYEKHISHFTVEEAIEVCRSAGSKTTYLTHMSHQIGLYEKIHDTLPQGVHFALDRLTVDICESGDRQHR